MKNNYQAFLLIGMLVLANAEVHARPLGKSGGHRSYIVGVKKSNHLQNGNQSTYFRQRNRENHSSSGGVPTVDIANLMESIKNQNMPKTQDDKAEVIRNIEGLRKSGNEITETLKPKKKP
jgi:hypothetical protein